MAFGARNIGLGILRRSGYDSIPCQQQKCLVHLIRDLNDDLWKNPFNAEYEQFVSAVRDPLEPIFTDIRRFGLKALHLRKYQKNVEHFYRDNISGQPAQDENTAKYQKRFERYRNSIFCFLSPMGFLEQQHCGKSASSSSSPAQDFGGFLQERCNSLPPFACCRPNVPVSK